MASRPSRLHGPTRSARTTGSVGPLPHAQDAFALVQDHSAHVDLRRGVAGTAAQSKRELGRRAVADRREQLGCQLAHLPVPVQVVVTSGGVGQLDLGQRGEA